MPIHTTSQKLAQAAYAQIDARIFNGARKLDKEYAGFAKRFPALIHTCGLAQAVAFARVKRGDYLEDLVKVLRLPSVEELSRQSRESSLSIYMRLSRNALAGAGWLKRFVEAVGEEG